MMNRDVAPWAADYIGIPFRDRGRDRTGCDCWGALMIIYAEQAGIALPSFGEAYCNTVDTQHLARLIARESALTGFRRVSRSGTARNRRTLICGAQVA